MPDTLRIALASFNPRMAETEANAARLRALRAQAAGEGADLLLAPLHALSGAVPAALAADPAFAEACEAALAALAAEPGPALILGAPWRDGPRLHDALHLLEGGAIRARRAAHEPRPGFDPGPVPGPVAFRGARLGLMAGADWRQPATPETLAETGAELLVALDALPFERGGEERVLQAALSRVVENDLPLILLNRLGAEEEAAHDGAALILNADRSPALRLPPFAETLAVTEWTRAEGAWRCTPQPRPPAMGEEEALWRALLLALRDHAARHAPAGILLPLRAGPEAALTAALATDAFAAEALHPLLLEAEATPLAQRLGLEPRPLALGPAATALAAALGATPPPDPLHRLALDSLALAGNLLPLTETPSDCPSAFAPLRHLTGAERQALAAWRNAHHPAGLLGPPAPGLPLPPASPAPQAGQAPRLTPWQSLAHADYKRRRLPPGLNPAPRAFGGDRGHILGHRNPDEAPAP
ncbi:NAD+ synthase [Roseomonas rosea]|uniref:NAD+ synthase n=1 Tax=Muricoccus roseus TaxID=198092 RepID=A0A1M6LRC1_9PROT|nr:nitrilase-related carbon-nitrogen hydrolase [Roseomonas rosea]SHJ73632.1 NAD+ synthase [Roseomonas rosea]